MMSYNYLKRGNNFEKYLGVFLSSCLIFFAIVILSKLLLFESVIDTSPTDYQNVFRIFKSAIIQAFFSTLLSVALGTGTALENMKNLGQVLDTAY